ncbi:MAG: GNAT family N-acetyltransferase [Clostridium sp.]
MNKLTVRKAKREDANVIAKLIYETEKYPDEEWGKGSKEEHLERLITLIKEEDNRFSYNNIISLEEDENVIGISLFLRGDKLKSQTLKADLKLMPMQKGIIKKISLSCLAIYYYFDNECERDELYLSNIIIDRSRRGRGLSNLLLNRIIEIAEEEELKKISLRANNEKLVEFYKSVGFKLVKEDKLIKYV